MKIDLKNIKDISVYKLNEIYKLPVLTLIILFTFLSFSFFKYYNALNLNKNLNFKKEILRIYKGKIEVKEKNILSLKREFNNTLKILNSISIYSPKNAIDLITSYKNIFVLDYKYKVLRKKGFYKIAKGKISFLSNYDTLKKYLSFLRKHGFYLLDITLKKYKYNQDNISLVCTLKFAFLTKSF